MARGNRVPTAALVGALADAEATLWTAWSRATRFQHRGERGDVREDGVGEFLAEQLPGAFEIATGEVVDCFDTRSTQLDVLVYDGVRNAPLSRSDKKVVLPAEALLAVVEVKSTLTRDELETCLRSAAKLRELRPFKSKFVGPRSDGRPADDGNCRCLYTVLAFASNLSKNDWPASEWKRLGEAGAAVGHAPALIDRIIVLDRGVISPPNASGKAFADDGAGALAEWFLQLQNFLTRENGRRNPTDLQMYTSRYAKGWSKL